MRTKTAMNRGIVIVMLLLAAPAARAADIVISDDDFLPGDWTATVVVASGGATQSETQQSSGGNPGSFRTMAHVLPSPSQIAVNHVFDAVSYDPSSMGAIDSIDYREDHIEFNPPFFGAAIGATPLVVQDGITYYGPDITYSNLSWTSVTRLGLTAASFSSGPNTPDFSASGGVIQFGFLRSNTNTPGGSAYTTQHGIDNWTFTVHRPEATGVEGSEASPALALEIVGPNPFSETVSIALGGSRQGVASVAIYDLTGRMVRTIAACKSALGPVIVNWDGADETGRRAPSGVYFLRRQDGSSTVTKKVVLVK